MPTVKLEDVVDIDIYSGIEPENNPEQTIWFESGVAVRDAGLDAKAKADSDVTNMPFWRDLDPNDEPDYLSNADDRSVPCKIVQGQMKGKRAHLGKSWAARDLTTEFTMGVDPMTRIRSRTSKYWQWQWQRRAIACVEGVYNANVAGNIDAGFGSAGDMILDVSVDDGTQITPATQFTYEAFVDAKFTMGERVGEVTSILMHPVIQSRLLKNNDIEFIPDSENKKMIQVYAGHRVIVSDNAPVVPCSTGGGFRYLTVIFGPAALGYGMGMHDTPFELYRDPSIGNGSGETLLFERNTWLIHVFGFSNTDAVTTGGQRNGSGAPTEYISQSLADLRNPANWQRNYFRQNVPLAFLRTN